MLTLSLHDALPIYVRPLPARRRIGGHRGAGPAAALPPVRRRAAATPPAPGRAPPLPGGQPAGAALLRGSAPPGPPSPPGSSGGGAALCLPPGGLGKVAPPRPTSLTSAVGRASRVGAMRREVSAGGVVLRERDGRYEVAVIRPRGRRLWALPKGHLDDGEIGRASCRERAKIALYAGKENQK